MVVENQAIVVLHDSKTQQFADFSVNINGFIKSKKIQTNLPSTFFSFHQQQTFPSWQGRIQDLSEGGGQDFLGTKKFIIRNKKFFDLKDSKRVKINH